jgi:hypothetical protein
VSPTTQKTGQSLQENQGDSIEQIADHCDEYSPSWPNTNRTARSRTSGEYLL